MSLPLLPLNNLRVPTTPERPLTLDRQPLHILNTEAFTPETDPSSLTAAIGLATVLYNWNPSALLALLDREAWFSFTWILNLNQNGADETKLEIGRIRDQITFGTLDANGIWKLMISYDISPSGVWVPDKDSMIDGRDVPEAAVIDQLARDFVREAVLQKRWLTGKKMRHDFFIEYAPMDVWADGIRMNPHWLYEALDLGRCTMCRKGGDGLSRCGKCGTAAYCSVECQKKDWAVHKGVCAMSMEDRGTALHLTSNGGLVGWRTVDADDDGEGGDEEGN